MEEGSIVLDMFGEESIFADPIDQSASASTGREGIMARKRAWEGSDDIKARSKVDIGKVGAGEGVVYIRGTDEVIITYNRPIRFQELHDNLCVMKKCIRGVLLKRGTKSCISSQHEIVPLDEYDFLASDIPRHIDYVRLAHRDCHILPNTYLSVDAVVRNDHLDPPRVYTIQLAVDSGAHMELVIPTKKAVQLGLEAKYMEWVRGLGGSVAMTVYRAVTVSLVSHEGKVFQSADLIPRAKVHDADQLLFQGGGSSLQIGSHTIDTTLSPLPLVLEEISPHKNVISNGILGLPALEKLQVVLDFGAAAMIPIIVEPLTFVCIVDQGRAMPSR